MFEQIGSGVVNDVFRQVTSQWHNTRMDHVSYACDTCKDTGRTEINGIRFDGAPMMIEVTCECMDLYRCENVEKEEITFEDRLESGTLE